MTGGAIFREGCGRTIGMGHHTTRARHAKSDKKALVTAAAVTGGVLAAAGTGAFFAMAGSHAEPTPQVTSTPAPLLASLATPNQLFAATLPPALAESTGPAAVGVAPLFGLSVTPFSDGPADDDGTATADTGGAFSGDTTTGQANPVPNAFSSFAAFSRAFSPWTAPPTGGGPPSDDHPAADVGSIAAFAPAAA